jgi:hypothetical protein
LKPLFGQSEEESCQIEVKAVKLDDQCIVNQVIIEDEKEEASPRKPLPIKAPRKVTSLKEQVIMGNA